MRFTVGRDDLGEAVAFVSRALPARPVIPLLSGMLVEADQEWLTISCFDYEVSARCRVAADVTEPGMALVPGRLLAEITRSLPARPAEFSGDSDQLDLVCGGAEFELVCLPLEDYPALPESPETVCVVDGGALAAAVSQVASSASRDDTLPMLTAIFADIDGDMLTLAATDRYRLAARQVPVQAVDADTRAVALIPARAMVEATRAMTAGTPVTVAFETGSESAPRSRRRTGPGTSDDDRPPSADGLISFEVGDRRLTARLIGGEFIKYQSRLAGEFGCYADLPPEPVIEAVRRAALVADRADPIRLTFSNGQVVIEAHAEGRARAAERVTATFTGDQPVIAFNPSYLLDGLVAAAAMEAESGGSGAGGSQPDSANAGSGSGEAGSEAGGGPAERGRIRLQFNTPARPALITWVDAGDGGDGDGDAGADGADDGGTDSLPGVGEESDAADGPEVAEDSLSEPVADFRYLLVPLRVPDRA